MKVMVRLYRQHDLDLLSLKKIDGFSVQKAMRSALRAYVRKQDFKVQIPDKIIAVALPKSSQLHICLSDSADADIIAWLQTVSNGFRNSLIKNIFRSYLSRPIADLYLEKRDTPAQDSPPFSIEKEIDNILNAPLTENFQTVKLVEMEPVLGSNKQ